MKQVKSPKIYKSMKNATISFLVVMCLMLDQTSFAQKISLPKAEDELKIYFEESNSDKVQLAIEVYHAKNVIPVLVEQRKKLETEISDKDKKQIVILRSELATAEKAFQEFKKRNAYGLISAAGLNEKQEEEYDKVITNLREKQQNIATLATKYSESIDALFYEKQVDFNKWYADKNYIQKMYFPHWKTLTMDTIQEYNDFILLNPEMNTIIVYENKLAIDNSSPLGTNQLDLELAEAGLVTIELYNEKDELLKTLMSENREAGKHRFSLKIKDDRYFRGYCKVIMDNGTTFIGKFD